MNVLQAFINVCCILASNEELDQVEVDYVTIPGWKSDITSVRKFEDLPPNAQAYVKKVEEIVQIPGKICCCIKVYPLL